MAGSPNEPCPCGSGRKYKRCCRPFHRGEVAAEPGSLVRARYSAYALGLASFIMDTTHPGGPMWQMDADFWRQTIDRFTAAMRFHGVDVLGAQVEEDRAEVYFHARMSRGGEDAGFREHSLFLRQDGRWLYHSGQDE